MMIVGIAVGLVLGVPVGYCACALAMAATRADERIIAEAYRRRLGEVLAAQNLVHQRTLGYHAGRERPELRN